jgi:hypothetical protein
MSLQTIAQEMSAGMTVCSSARVHIHLHFHFHAVMSADHHHQFHIVGNHLNSVRLARKLPLEHLLNKAEELSLHDVIKEAMLMHVWGSLQTLCHRAMTLSA